MQFAVQINGATSHQLPKFPMSLSLMYWL
jgi:hypothetical protein